MYKLTKKIKSMLLKDVNLRTRVALGMGVGENAITMSLRRNGGDSIANNIGAVKSLQNETKFEESQIIELRKATA